eukprot:comp24003_c4_seq1/m.42777 comp24003_c4_seq1/g.42777  ORF comp24003_c4_seq1/g.42777 comp24003_c4_seq1/m.42777 type:complete len:194 (-) comp24003_c4_seq1:451-1032(-)
MERSESCIESELLRPVAKGCLGGVRLVAGAVLLTVVAVCQSLLLLKMLWLWFGITFLISFVRNVLAHHRHLRHNGRLLTSIDPVNLRLSLIDRDFNENDYEALLALDEGVAQSKGRGLSDGHLSLLPAETVCSQWLTTRAHAHQSECAICLEPHAIGQRVRPLPCNHAYHVLCIDTWLRLVPTCPVCKLQLRA